MLRWCLYAVVSLCFTVSFGALGGFWYFVWAWAFFSCLPILIGLLTIQERAEQREQYRDLSEKVFDLQEFRDRRTVADARRKLGLSPMSSDKDDSVRH